MSFKSAVITFPGSNCDRDALCYLKDLTKGEVHNVWHEETSLPKVDLVILPGGFSFGDYLRSGAMASKSKIIDEVVKHANDNRYLLGICNGFQILTEIGLLEGALIRNKNLKFLGKNCFIKKKFKNNEQIAFEYCKGEFSNTEENINGSIEAIAGITNKKKNVLGMMPHPERAYSDFHQSQDGRLTIESLIS